MLFCVGGLAVVLALFLDSERSRHNAASEGGTARVRGGSVEYQVSPGASNGTDTGATLLLIRVSLSAKGSKRHPRTPAELDESLVN